MMSGRFRAVAVVIAVAAIVFVVYRNGNRHSRTTSSVPIRVLVANRLIQKGTMGGTIRSDAGLYRVVSFRRSQIKTGAIDDPSELVGKVAVKDIPAGQQLTAGDFARTKRRVLFP